MLHISKTAEEVQKDIKKAVRKAKQAFGAYPIPEGWRIVGTLEHELSGTTEAILETPEHVFYTGAKGRINSKLTTPFARDLEELLACFSQILAAEGQNIDDLLAG